MFRKGMITLLTMLVTTVAFAQVPIKNGPPAGVQVPTQNPHYLDSRAENVWCITDRLWEERRQKMGKSSYTTKAGCPTEGACDIPGTRDATALTAKTVDVVVHVMRDGSGNGGVSQATVDASIAQMNSDYAGTGIDFVLKATRFHNDNNYSCVGAYSPFNSNWFNDIQNMKATYAETPTENINVFISCQDPSSWGTLLGIATFPWDPNALTSTGGLWMNDIAVGSGATTLAHEMGHCLGLWHTHHGVSEVNDCSDCYEFASGFEGDIRGDFAADTPPTPTNYNCAGPGGSDCQGTAWGTTQPENFMGYGPDSCQSLFTANQTSRMHCWSESVLSGWYSSGTGGNQPPTASFTSSTTDLSASFDGSGSSDSDGTIVSYDWSFGDGNTGSGVTTSHTYAAGGTYTVTLTVTDDQGASSQDSQNVTVIDPNASNITLSTNGYKVKGVHTIDLTWSGAAGTSVDIYRNGSLIATTANDGAYTDSTGNKGGGSSYTYEVCESGSSTCSNTSTAVY